MMCVLAGSYDSRRRILCLFFGWLNDNPIKVFSHTHTFATLYVYFYNIDIENGNVLKSMYTKASDINDVPCYIFINKHAYASKKKKRKRENDK